MARAAVNAFTSVRIEKDESVRVSGFTGDDADLLTAIDVAIFAAGVDGESDRRLQAPVKDLGSDWHADGFNLVSAPFTVGETVDVVGVAMYDGPIEPNPFLWHNRIKIVAGDTAVADPPVEFVDDQPIDQPDADPID